MLESRRRLHSHREVSRYCFEITEIRQRGVCEGHGSGGNVTAPFNGHLTEANVCELRPSIYIYILISHTQLHRHKQRQRHRQTVFLLMKSEV